MSTDTAGILHAHISPGPERDGIRTTLTIDFPAAPDLETESPPLMLYQKDGQGDRRYVAPKIPSSGKSVLPYIVLAWVSPASSLQPPVPFRHSPLLLHITINIRKGLKKWKFEMAFAMKGGGVSRAINVF